ncbi:PH and SEC7 domain-containing protein 4-like [Pezoporus wallicus]|uniref:PH and SEC7 domain-containing protein 4-like n=1 Tax=Pezoporus wallicus TaxID=35540 RepID=UPI00254C98B3|nr:PH and SEC7 domain-containing protein 4-like [Pezoporus wallicus]
MMRMGRRRRPPPAPGAANPGRSCRGGPRPSPTGAAWPGRCWPRPGAERRRGADAAGSASRRCWRGPSCSCAGRGPPEAPLGVHHALAERAPAYTKRPDVFRLRAADGSRFLFQAPTPREMLAWIERLNLAAALLSAPPFPAAVGSQRGPARPLLPAALSRSPPEEQRRSHAAWMERVERELRQRQRHGPGPDPRQHRRDTELLLHERRRYETYVRVLDSWLRGRAEPGWEAEAEPGAAPGPPRAENESERGTLRSLVGRRLRERP